MESNILDIAYDPERTKEAFEKYLSLSWSSFDNFRSCKGLWLINYFLKAPEIYTIVLEKENSRAIPGTIIQKLFEVFVNKRVYKRPEMRTFDNLLEWCNKNIVALFYLSYFPFEEQFKKEHAYTKDFFKKALGKKHLQAIQERYGLDQAFEDINISYVRREVFNSIYDSPEKLLVRIQEMLPKILKLFVSMNLNLDFMQSEIYLKIGLGKFTLTGSIDFICNTKQNSGEFCNLSDLRSGYTLLDGKYNLSATVKEEQLQFYSYLVFQKTRKIPEKLGFIEWTKSKFKEVPFNPEFVRYLEDTLLSVKEEGEKIKSKLADIKWVGPFYESNLTSLCTGAHCTYCLGVDYCPEAISKGIKGFKKSNSSKFKKSTLSDISNQGLSDAPISEITL